MLAVLFIVAAWISTPVRLDAAARDSRMTRVSVLTGAAVDLNDVRLIQSPVLFSLPARAGFSAPLRDQVMRESAPPASPPPDLFFTPTPEFPRRPFGLTGKTLDEMIEPLDGHPVVPVVAGASASSSLGQKKEGGYRIYWQENPDELISGLEAPAVRAGVVSASWQAVYFVCFDADGFVEQLLVETPPPTPALNEQWLKLLRRWQPGDAVPAGRCRRIVVSFRSFPGKGG